MFLTSFITIVDGLFIGNKIGEYGLAAINLTFPVLYFLLGITIMIGLGGMTLAVRNLGEKDILRARQRFTFTFLLNASVTIVIIVVLRIFLDEVIFFLNAKGVLKDYVKDYLGTMTFFYFFMMMNIIGTMFIRGEGKPQLSLFFGISGNIMNILLDYILIVRLNAGMQGAALASGISVLIPFILGCLYFLSSKSTFKFVRFKFDFTDLKKIVLNGFSEFISQISICITTYLFNYIILKRIGINGVAAFTIVGYLSFIQYMILTGIAQGVNTLVSYSFGARDRDRIIKLLSIGIKSVLITGVIAFILSMVAAEGIVKLFAGDRTGIVEIARNGIRIYALTFLLNGYNLIASAYFTSLGDAKTSAAISILRSLILINLFVFLLPVMIGDVGIWFAGPLTEALTCGFSYIHIHKSKRYLHFN